eukprot:2192908-Prymnesium_polylepis.1
MTGRERSPQGLKPYVLAAPLLRRPGCPTPSIPQCPVRPIRVHHRAAARLPERPAPHRKHLGDQQ